MSRNPLVQKFATAAAGVAGLECTTFRTSQTLGRALSDAPTAPVFLDAPSRDALPGLEVSFLRLAGEYHFELNPNRFCYFGAAGVDRYDYLLKSRLFGSFIHFEAKEAEAAGRRFGRILAAPTNGQNQPLAVFLNPDAHVEEIPLATTLDKAAALEEVKKILGARELPADLIAKAVGAADELLTNAMYNAPLEEVPRGISIPLSGSRRINFSLGFDGEQVALQTVDWFGSLERKRLPGAGLASVLQSGASLLLHCREGEFTEVTVFFRAGAQFLVARFV